MNSAGACPIMLLGAHPRPAVTEGETHSMSPCSSESMTMSDTFSASRRYSAATERVAATPRGVCVTSSMTETTPTQVPPPTAGTGVLETSSHTTDPRAG